MYARSTSDPESFSTQNPTTPPTPWTSSSPSARANAVMSVAPRTPARSSSSTSGPAASIPSVSMKERYRAPMRVSGSAASTIARTSASARSRSWWNVPSTPRSAGMAWVAIQSPLTWR